MIPESPLPQDPHTCEVLGREVDQWWQGLSLGQRLAVAQPYVTAREVETKARGEEDVVEGEVID